MARTLEEIDEFHREWISRQPVFFVATAPAGPDGHVNLSPKGYDSFRVLGPTTVSYLDLTGSGVETIAHLRENGRITIMFCAFDGPPRIFRLYGRGTVIRPGDEGWERASAPYEMSPGVRSVIEVECDRIQTSCGYAVPFMDFVGERDTLHEWGARKDPEAIADYHAEKNSVSIDGLPGIDVTA